MQFQELNIEPKYFIVTIGSNDLSYQKKDKNQNILNSNIDDFKNELKSIFKQKNIFDVNYDSEIIDLKQEKNTEKIYIGPLPVSSFNSTIDNKYRYEPDKYPLLKSLKKLPYDRTDSHIPQTITSSTVNGFIEFKYWSINRNILWHISNNIFIPNINISKKSDFNNICFRETLDYWIFKVDSWIDWYTTQKQIFESVK